MRIAVVGAGAVGSLFAARLRASTTASVSLIGKRRQRIRCFLSGNETISMEVDTMMNHTTNLDVVLIATKSFDVEDAACQLSRHCESAKLIVTLCNGLGHEQAIQRGWQKGMQGIVGKLPSIALGVTYVGAKKEVREDDRDVSVKQTGEGETILGFAAETSRNRRVGGDMDTGIDSDQNAFVLNQFCALLNEAGLSCSVSGHVEARIWEKLVVNVVINSLTAILEVRNGALCAAQGSDTYNGSQPIEALVDAASSECDQVLQAIRDLTGLPIKLEVKTSQHVYNVARATASNTSSMLADIKGTTGRTEVEAIVQPIIDKANEYGIRVPTLTALANLVRAKSRI